MISTRVAKAEVLAKLIPIIDELASWEKEHREDKNPGRFNAAGFIKLKISDRAIFAVQLYRLCEFKGDSFISIDLESVHAYTSLTLENVRADFATYEKLRAEFASRPVPVKPVVSSDDYRNADKAVVWSLVIVTVSLIAIFA